MTPTTSGWMIFITALGMMCGLLAPEIAKLTTVGQMIQPPFISVAFAHFATVVLAFMAGKMIPTERDPERRTRAADTEPVAPEPPKGDA